MFDYNKIIVITESQLFFCSGLITLNFINFTKKVNSFTLSFCILLLQFSLFTAIHKHYCIDDWKEFAAKHPECLEVKKKKEREIKHDLSDYHFYSISSFMRTCMTDARCNLSLIINR